jgi:hypothetical protein
MADEQRGDEEVDQRDLERALAVLRPAGSQIDRDNFLFLAGRASAEPVRPGSTFGRWVWPAATLLSSVATIVLSVLLVSRPQPAVTRGNSMTTRADQPRNSAVADVSAQSSSQRVAATRENDADLPSPAVGSSALPTADVTARALAGESNYPRLRSFVLAYGIDALPEPAPLPRSASDSATDDEPRTQREMLRQTLKERAASRSSSGSAG